MFCGSRYSSSERPTVLSTYTTCQIPALHRLRAAAETRFDHVIVTIAAVLLEIVVPDLCLDQLKLSRKNPPRPQNTRYALSVEVKVLSWPLTTKQRFADGTASSVTSKSQSAVCLLFSLTSPSVLASTSTQAEYSS